MKPCRSIILLFTLALFATRVMGQDLLKVNELEQQLEQASETEKITIFDMNEVLCVLFRFPLDDPTRVKQWLANMKRDDLHPGASTKLCSDHFKDSDYTGVPRQSRLTKTAVPSIFTFPPHLMVCIQNIIAAIN